MRKNISIIVKKLQDSENKSRSKKKKSRYNRMHIYQYFNKFISYLKLYKEESKYIIFKNNCGFNFTPSKLLFDEVLYNLKIFNSPYYYITFQNKKKFI